MKSILMLMVLWVAAPAFAADVAYSLDQALDQAMKTNFQVRRALAFVEKERGALAESRAGLLPSVTISGIAKKIDEDRLPKPTGAAKRRDDMWSARVEATQTLFIGGRESADTARDVWRRRAAVDGLKAVVNDVILSVHEHYYAVLFHREQVVVREQAVALLEEQLSAEKKKRDAGIVSDFNVLRADTALSNAKTEFIAARNALNIARENFRAVLGVAAHADVEGELGMDVAPVDLDASIKKALSHRPELGQLEKLLKAGYREVWAARTDYMPQLDAFAFYEKERTPFGFVSTDPVEGWEAGLRGQWNVFNSGASTARVHQAKAGRTLAAIDVEEARLNIEIEVRRTYFSLLEAIELVNTAEKGVDQARESLRLAQARFDAGVATQLDLLDSQVSLTQAGTNKASALFEYNVSLARHRRALGEFVR